VIARVPFKICVTRLVRTLILRAFSRAHIERFKLLGQVFAGMDSSQCQNDAPQTRYFAAMTARSRVSRMKRV
jgi:hypothetical protein